jgi:hypothetical protein
VIVLQVLAQIAVCGAAVAVMALRDWLRDRYQVRPYHARFDTDTTP